MSYLDKLGDEYKYELDLSYKFSAYWINVFNFGKFWGHAKDYKFNERVEEINKYIKEGKARLEKVILDSILELANGIKTSVTETIDQLKKEKKQSWDILRELREDYNTNKDYISDAGDVYKRVASAILDENISKYIKYDKKFFKFNEILNDIFKQLNLNYDN